MPKKRYGNKLKKPKLPLSKSHLQSMRGLTQFERCWTIIDSHLELYKTYEKLSQRMAESIEQRYVKGA